METMYRKPSFRCLPRELTPDYITYGVRCSKFHRQGHRPASCPLGITGERYLDTQQSPVSKSPSTKPTPSNNSALSTSAAELSASIKQTSSSPAASSPVANIPVHP
ncbi:hypothetical protein LAZ67_20002616 [Cordylochernes scorpioides]|uniref:Uncharacterized protein n=1 Tax=Cordylochernes scorpioides TaxID=51811 RepID=A0ABY6LKW4_9ARAC|nr:hypothetical protein LAZ67_20002616 [Cordylochernes scorpioides]